LAIFETLDRSTATRLAIANRCTPSQVQDRFDDIAMEKHFANTHRDAPCGRFFATWNHPDFSSAKKKIHENFDKAFPTAPGSSAYLAKIFCDKCGKRKAWCECEI
jgi:hypothetical protein